MKSSRKRDYKAKRWNQEEFRHLDSIIGVSRENKERLIIWVHGNMFQEEEMLNSIICCCEFQKDENRKCSFGGMNIVFIFMF